MSTGFATLASAGSTERSAATVVSESGVSSSPEASHASAQRMPSPPAFVRTATPARRGRGCVEKSVATSISSSSDPARITPAWRKSASTAASEPASAAVCELAARRPARRGAALQGEDGLAPRDPPGEPAEPARIAERLDVEQDRLGRLVVLPPLEQVVGGDVRLVADRDERREPERPRLGGLQQREAERAALRREADVPGAAPRGRRTWRSAWRRRPRCRGSSGRSGGARGRGRARAGAPAAPRPRCPISAKPAEITTSARTPCRSACSAAARARRRRQRR